MPRWQRAQLTACAGVIGYMFGYVVTDYVPLPHLYYFQYERRWRMAERLTGLPSGYVGLWAWALVAGLTAASITYVALRWRATPVPDRTLGLVLAWTITASLLAAGYFTWHNWP